MIMYTILPDGTVASIGRDDDESKLLSIIDIVDELRDAFNAEK